MVTNIPALVAKAYPTAMKVENITSGFRVTGIFPHNADVFPEDDDQVLTAASASASLYISAPATSL